MKKQIINPHHRPEKPESQILLSFCIFYGHALHALIFYTPYSDLPAYDTTR